MSLFEVRIHGRGGQGVVTAAEMLSIAAFNQGRHAQAFPSFGSERTGAPVVAFCRIDDHEIRVREPVMVPNALIIQDPSLLHQIDVLSGLGEDGYLLVNSAKSFDELGFSDFVSRLRSARAVTVPASEIARETVGRPMPNAVLLGAFAALTGLVSLEAVAVAVREKFSGAVAERNVAGAARGFEMTQELMTREPVGAAAD